MSAVPWRIPSESEDRSLCLGEPLTWRFKLIYVLTITHKVVHWFGIA